MLTAGGMKLADIAKASGVSEKTLVATRTRKYTTGPAAAAVLAVELRPSTPSKLNAVGTARRIRALVAMGWTLAEQGRRLDMHNSHVWQLCWQDLPTVTPAMAERIQGLFAELWDQPGPSRRARNLAVKHGWAPPLAWDDIDDPAAEPDRGAVIDEAVDEVAVARAVRGERLRLNEAEEAEALRLGVERGEPLTRVSKRLGINYVGAQILVAGGSTPGRAKRTRVEAEVLRLGDTHSDRQLAALLGVHPPTVASARRRLAARQDQLAS
jgi:hypothetical protein